MPKRTQLNIQLDVEDRWVVDLLSALDGVSASELLRPVVLDFIARRLDHAPTNQFIETARLARDGEAPSSNVRAITKQRKRGSPAD